MTETLSLRFSISLLICGRSECHAKVSFWLFANFLLGCLKDRCRTHCSLPYTQPHWGQSSTAFVLHTTAIELLLCYTSILPWMKPQSQKDLQLSFSADICGEASSDGLDATHHSLYSTHDYCPVETALSPQAQHSYFHTLLLNGGTTSWAEQGQASLPSKSSWRNSSSESTCSPNGIYLSPLFSPPLCFSPVYIRLHSLSIALYC